MDEKIIYCPFCKRKIPEDSQKYEEKFNCPHCGLSLIITGGYEGEIFLDEVEDD